jgi:hypothetical protein
MQSCKLSVVNVIVLDKLGDLNQFLKFIFVRVVQFFKFKGDLAQLHAQWIFFFLNAFQSGCFRKHFTSSDAFARF